MNKRLLLIASTLTLCLTTAQASDRSIRCKGNLIYGGGGKNSSGMYEVLKKCGEPEAKMGNTWIYIQGNMRRVLTFNYEGRLQKIESVRE